MKQIQLLFLSLTISSFCFSQPNVELGAAFGQSYYVGDLNTTSHFTSDLLNTGFSVFIRNNFDGRWSWKNQILIAKVNGDDALSSNPTNNLRNLSFNSPIYEFSSVFEFNFLEYRNFNENDKISPYLFGGLGVFYMEPKTELNGNLYDLRLLMTEGQTEPYNRVNLNIPIGIGVKARILQRLSINIAWGMRKTFTDYLDDVSGFYPDPSKVSALTASVSNRSTNQLTAFNNNWESQRGNRQTNDWYGYMSFGLAFRITKDPSSCHFTPFY